MKESGFLMAVSRHGTRLRGTVMCARSVMQKHSSAAWRVHPVAVGGEELIGRRDTYRANSLRTW